MSNSHPWYSWQTWRNLGLQAVVIGVVVIALILLLVFVNLLYFNDPPVVATSLEPANLGMLCPGDDHPIHLSLEITGSFLGFYYFSTTDPLGKVAYIGTQSSFPGLPHQYTGKYEQIFPWKVPDLPPGFYRLVITIRGTDGREDPVFLNIWFFIGEEEFC